jgi:uncharacterized membrane protein YidH (DUF202 family)
MKWHVFAMLVSVAISLIGLGMIATQTDPYSTTATVRLLFFASLLILLWGLTSLTALYIKYRLTKQKIDDKSILSSYVIGFFISLIGLGIIAINIWI